MTKMDYDKFDVSKIFCDILSKIKIIYGFYLNNRGFMPLGSFGKQRLKIFMKIMNDLKKVDVNKGGKSYEIEIV